MTAFAALALAAALQSRAAEPEGQVLDHAEFVFSDSATPPGPEAPWRPVKLPDNWYVSHPGEAGVGWYRLTFDVSESDLSQVHGMYMPRNSAGRIAFFINGQFRSGARGYGIPGTRGWSPPVVSATPPALLKLGRNELHVRVAAVADLRQGLTRIVVGRTRVTRSLYEMRYAEQVTTLFMFGAAALLLGMLAAVLWLRERSDATLLWFAVTALAWAAAAFPGVHAVLIPEAFTHGTLAFATRFAYAAPMLMLGLRVAGRRWPRAEIALWGFTLTGLALAGLVSDAHEGTLITIWSAAYLAALAALLPLLMRVRSERGLSFWILVAAIGLAVLLNAHDLAWWFAWTDYDSLQLAHFHVPLVLFAIGATIVNRHFHAVAAVERANVVLERRVADKTREIEENFARLQEADREKALARERQRIMADMHDGLGSSLVGLLGVVQSRKPTLQEVERRLLDALQELRMSVDALEPVDGDLGVVLGNVRHRMRTAIEDSGVKLNWRVDDLPPVSNLTPRAILNVQRIVSEALANALRHAQATTVTVSARGDGECLRVDVVDDGVGFAGPARPGGRGLDNLRHRAASLGATLDVRSEPGAGTRVALQLPLRLPGDSAAPLPV